MLATPFSETYVTKRCIVGAARPTLTENLPAVIRRLPPRRFLGTLLLRGTALWVLSHLMAKLALAMKAASAPGFAVDAAVIQTHGDPSLPIWSLVMSATLMLVDLLRRKELVLLNNLGVATAGAVMVGVLPAIVGEVLLLTIIL